MFCITAARRCRKLEQSPYFESSDRRNLGRSIYNQSPQYATVYINGFIVCVFRAKSTGFLALARSILSQVERVRNTLSISAKNPSIRYYHINPFSTPFFKCQKLLMKLFNALLLHFLLLAIFFPKNGRVVIGSCQRYNSCDRNTQTTFIP